MTDTACLQLFSNFNYMHCRECNTEWPRETQELKRHRMREQGSDGNLNVMFFKNVQIICLMTLLTKAEEGLLSGALLIILHGIYLKT